MKPLPIERESFDAALPVLEAVAREWAGRECTSFDSQIDGARGSGDCTIWDMPAIDSKRTVSLLVELEPMLGCKLPPSLVKRGGYASVEELVADLLPKIRERCKDAPPVATARLKSSTAIPRSSY